MNDQLQEMINKIAAWVDTEKDGLAYDHATHFCHDCPRRDDAEWREHVAPECCKELEDYQAQEWAAIESATAAMAALQTFKRHFDRTE